MIDSIIKELFVSFAYCVVPPLIIFEETSYTEFSLILSSLLAGNVGVVSGIFSPQNDVGADMSAPCRQHDTDHVGDMAPCQLAGRCVGVVSA